MNKQSKSKFLEKLYKELDRHYDKCSFQVDEVGDGEFIIEPDSYKGKHLDGMQLIYSHKDKIYEVSEFQAGKNQNELHIFLETKSLKRALTNLFKGNNRPKHKVLKIWS